MHFCANLVCQPAGQPEAVLLRAGQVLSGVELAAEPSRLRTSVALSTGAGPGTRAGPAVPGTRHRSRPGRRRRLRGGFPARHRAARARGGRAGADQHRAARGSEPGRGPAMAVLGGRRWPRFPLSSVEAAAAKAETGFRPRRRRWDDAPVSDIIDDLSWRGLIAVSYRPGRSAQGAGHRGGDLLLRIRPDRAWPAHRQPGAAADHAPAPAGRAPADRHGRRRYRADRRPGRQVGRASAQPARARRRAGSSGSGPRSASSWTSPPARPGRSW